SYQWSGIPQTRGHRSSSEKEAGKRRGQSHLRGRQEASDRGLHDTREGLGLLVSRGATLPDEAQSPRCCLNRHSPRLNVLTSSWDLLVVDRCYSHVRMRELSISAASRVPESAS